MFEFEFKLSDDAEKYLAKVSKKIDDTRPMLTKGSMVMLTSLDKNFRSEGRPKKWKGLAPLTKALRRNKNKGQIKILQDTNQLRGSMSAKVTKKQAEIGTNLEKAPLLNFGGTSKPSDVTIKRHKRTITQAFGKPIQPKRITVGPYKMHIPPKQVPARPFVLFQKQDVDDLQRLGVKHLEEATQ